MSLGERLGEWIGYGVGVVIYGPRAALEQRHLRRIRRAFAAWLADERYTKQIAEPGRVRRLVERQDDELALLLECELRPLDDRAFITIRLEKLPHMEDDRVAVETKAPRSAGEWSDLAEGAVRAAAKRIRRHRGGYR